ncbi:MAG TPA: hypothetical protein VE967_06825 [Gemmatimonadaceae bacterium]|nr:hypothetical protein [Gemmatimonadaceae bacterium]
MANAWKPFREPLRATLTRTIGIAAIAATVVALTSRGFGRWPALFVVMLWPSFGGHWIELFYLNWLRPHVPPKPYVQRVARIAVWFAGGVVMAVGARWTASALLAHPAMPWLTWITAGGAFIAIELVVHAALQMRGRASFYNGLG